MGCRRARNPAWAADRIGPLTALNYTGLMSRIRQVTSFLSDVSR